VRGYRYLVIGNSAAAVNACEALRAVDREGSLAVFSEERYRCYSRPLISYLVAGEISPTGMYYRPQGFYRSVGADFHRGERIEEVDGEKKTVTSSTGDKFSWDKLLLATGFRPFIPPIEGLEEVDYLTFVSWDDAKRMLDLTRRPLRALIIGAGLIGMKAAEALHARGARVVVVEKMERILPQALDAEASSLVEGVCRKAGLELATGEGVRRVEAGGKTKGKAVLEGGSEVDFDLLVVAVGVRPRLELAEQAGLRVGRGIVVDESQRTSHPDIFAAGDVAEAHDIVREEPTVNALWPVAALQGKYAGKNMAGGDASYPGCHSMNSVEFFGLPVLSAGLVNPPDDGYETIVRRGEGKEYRKVVLKGDTLVGMIVAGKIERAGLLTSLIQERSNVSRIKKFLLEEGFGHIHLPKAVRRSRIEEARAGISRLEGGFS
jgi:NAD(P)H-nitrite reductase large subunit